jgi:predicted nucleic acid-binding protein
MRTKVYVETSVVSYYTARPSRDVVVAGHQQVTHDFWNRLGHDYEPYVSAAVLAEIGEGNEAEAAKRVQAVLPFHVIQITPEAEALARQIVAGKGTPPEYPEDALHVALAAIGGVDFLATWNFSHINNPFTRMMIRQIVENEGYVCPEIVSPDELLGEET